ncbi:MAG TPA: heavy-metal-associated domain-containing protein [Casimicrobiaceae bacterium]|jgi:copper chaperone|nr:heavy-metal-associated domain-containing protein [Casimicrobiaceae bacterium]
MNNVTFKVEGMHCTSCAATIQALLQRNDGVKRASASFEEGEARVLYDPAAISEDQLADVIQKAGYRVADRRASS